MGVVFLNPLQRSLSFMLPLVCAQGARQEFLGQDKVAELLGDGFHRDCLAWALPSSAQAAKAVSIVPYK